MAKLTQIAKAARVEYNKKLTKKQVKKQGKGVWRLQRRVWTGDGFVEYELTVKKVKNINLRVSPQGDVRVSAPRRVPVGEIDRFVASRAGWIAVARRRVAVRADAAPVPCTLTDAQCMQVFRPYLEKYYPVFEKTLGAPPQIVLKTLKSMWGICRPARKQITLNRRLAQQPAAAVEYVVLHEYLHFWYPDHGKAFHRALDRMMPDNRQRRALLRRAPTEQKNAAD